MNQVDRHPPERSGGAGLDDEGLAEHAQRGFDAGDGRAPARVEHAAHVGLVHPEPLGEARGRQAVVAQGERERRLGGRDGRDGDVMLCAPPGAGHRDGLRIVDAPRDRLLERIGGLGKCFGFIGAGGEAFGQIAERDDAFAGAIGLQSCGVGESHGSSLLASPEIASVKTGLTNHGRQKSGFDLLSAVFDDGLASAVVDEDVAALGALGVDAEKDAALTGDLSHPVDELAAIHGSGSAIARTLGSVWPGLSARQARECVAGALRLVMAAMLLGVAQTGSAEEAPDDGCPRAALRQMMATAAAHDAVGDVAAIELEVLRLCTARQALFVKLAEGEARLGELRGVAPAAPPPAPVAAMRPPVEALAPPVKATAPLPDVIAPDPDAAVMVPADIAPARAPARPELRWTTVYGSAGEWTAGVTDGAAVWYVRAGDTLPSGVEVVSVRVRPPGVAVGRNGTAWQLPGPGEG